MSIKKKVSNKVVILIGSAILLLCLCFAVFNTDYKFESSEELEATDNTNVNTDIRSYADLKSIVSSLTANKTDIATISTDNTEQAKIYLSLLGLELSDVANYALCIDPMVDNSYAVAIIQPNKEAFDKCKLTLINYVGDKQESLKDGTDARKIADEAIIYEYKEYIMLIMTNDNQKYLDEAKEKLSSELSLNENTKDKTDDVKS